MRRNAKLAMALVLIVCGLVFVGGPVWAQGFEIRMQRVLAQFVVETGNQFRVVGSWITGENFNQATSDFDITLMARSGSTEAQQIARWRAARLNMMGRIRREFGAQADDILARTNLYPQQQLMRAVRSPTEALSRFKELRYAPNLGYTGRVTDATPYKFYEGSYGPGAARNIRNYERTAGRILYRNGNRCVSGLSELAYVGCAEETATVAGTANMAGQAAGKGLQALGEGRGASVLKYLVRVQEDLIKSRSLAGLAADPVLNREMRGMVVLLESTPQALPNVADDVARLLWRARIESGILGAYEGAGPMRRATLRVLMDGVIAGNAVGKNLTRLMRAVGEKVTLHRAITGVVVLYAIYDTSGKAGEEEDVLATLACSVSHLKWLTNFGPLVLTELILAMRKDAEATGQDMCAATQEAWDLMLGIYTVEGRVVGFDPDNRRKLTLANMVARFQYEERLAAVVYAHALRASDRGIASGRGTLTGNQDLAVAASTFARCWPTIRTAWLWERENLVGEYLELNSQVAHTPLLIFYKPEKPEAGEQIICEAISQDKELGERLLRMKEIMRLLYGRGSGVYVNYFWEPRGVSAGARDRFRSFTFNEPGKHPVKVRLELMPHTSHTRTNPRVVAQRDIWAAVDVVVVGGVTTPDEAPGEACWVLTKCEPEMMGKLEQNHSVEDDEDELPTHLRHRYGIIASRWSETCDVQMAGPHAMQAGMTWKGEHKRETRDGKVVSEAFQGAATVRLEWSPLPERIYVGPDIVPPHFALSAQYNLESGLERDASRLRAALDPGIASHEVGANGTTMQLDGPLHSDTGPPAAEDASREFVLTVWAWEGAVYDDDIDNTEEPVIGARVVYTYTWDPTGTMKPITQ